MTTPAFDHYAMLNDRDATRGKFAVLTDDAENDYAIGSTNYQRIVPAGTVLKLDSCGDYGLYALADLGGRLSKVLIPLKDLTKVHLTEGESARELVPAMADEIEALRAENAQLKAVLVAIQFYVRGQVDAVEDMRVSPADVMAVAAKLREFKSGKHVADMLHELDGDRE